MDNTVADEPNPENKNDFDLDIYLAIAKIRSDGKRPYSESIFKYINSVKKYKSVTVNFTNDRILTLLDDEIITNKVWQGFLISNRKNFKITS